MRIEKLLRRYLCRELLQYTVDDLRRAQKRAGAAVLLKIGQRMGRVSRTQGNAPHRNDLPYLPLNTRHHGPPRQPTGHTDSESGRAQRRPGVLLHPLAGALVDLGTAIDSH
jgi:hypothetical protein